MIDLPLPTQSHSPRSAKTAVVPDGEWKKGSPVKAECLIPAAETVHGYQVQLVVNGRELRANSTVALTFDEFDAAICAIRHRQRMDFIAKFGDPDVPRRGVTINVATLPGR